MYTAYVLSPSARAEVLKRFPPKFPDVIAHHVTRQFGVSGNAAYIEPAQVEVVAYVCDESLEALVVAVNGTINRPDGKVFHITLSLDKSKGRKPVDSNAVIKDLKNELVDVETFEIETTPQIID